MINNNFVGYIKNFLNVLERLAIRNVSESFEWRIRQRSRGLTCVSRASRRRRTALLKKVKAFTLVEVVIALTIIGVVTVLTLPTLQANVEDLIFKVRKKVLLTRVSQALPLLDTLRDFHSAEDFLDQYRDLVKVHMVCAGDKFFGCGLPQTITATDGTIFRMPKSWGELNPKLVDMFYEDAETGSVYSYHQEDFDSVAFFTDNGESINIFFNPVCSVFEQKDFPNYFSASSVCINMIYDLNGIKAPNTVGKDIGFITVFKPVDSIVVGPNPYYEDIPSKTQSEAAGKACSLQSGKLRAPTDYELAAMFVNTRLLGLHEGYYWSSSLYSADYAWYLWGTTGLILREPLDRTTEMDLRCVNR